MFKNESNYNLIIILHIVLGGIIFAYPPISTIYSVLIITFGIYYIVKNQNRNHEALLISGYVVAVEVLLRMTDATMINEYGKYSIILFLLIGIGYRGVSRNYYIYIVFILLLCPALLLSTKLSTDVVFRKAISFNISGPLCLTIASIYCINRPISFKTIIKLFHFLQYSLITVLVYIVLYTPEDSSITMKTDSNFATSGGFGPNQVSTILGIGMFTAFALFLFSKSKFSKLIQLLLFIVFTYRALITFSRGGFYTGLVVIVVLIIYLYLKSNFNAKIKISKMAFLFILGFLLLIGYTAIRTNGMIINRYTNKNAIGMEKASNFSGREEIAEAEIELFLENPVFGVGIGRNKEEKEKILGHQVATHNEITRLLAEHGVFGLLAFLILMFYPLFTQFTTRSNIFFYSFFLFWLLTINHAAMRIAASALIYALSLLKIRYDET